MMGKLSKIAPKQRQHIRFMRLYVTGPEDLDPEQFPAGPIDHLDSFKLVVLGPAARIHGFPFDRLKHAAIQPFLRVDLPEAIVQFK
jgi:hypothetical protein